MHTTPFTIHMLEKEGRIVLAGTLDGSPEVRAQLEEFFKSADLDSPRRWIIDASKVLHMSGGALNWIKAVHTYLMDCQLLYVPCQLVSILTNTARYQHKHSFIIEETSFGTAGVAPRSEPGLVYA